MLNFYPSPFPLERDWNICRVSDGIGLAKWEEKTHLLLAGVVLAGEARDKDWVILSIRVFATPEEGGVGM